MTMRDHTDRHPGLLEDIIERIPVRVFWKDRNSRYLGCNTPFARDAGTDSPRDVVGRTDYEFVWRQQADSYRADDREVMQSGHSKIAFEERQTRASGELRWLRTSKVALQDPSGEVFGVLGIYEDVTERKLMEQRLRESEGQFRSLIEQSPLATQVVDADGRTLAVNTAWTRLWGVPLEALKDYSILEDEQLVALGVIEHVRRAFAGEVVEVPEVEYDKARTDAVSSDGG
ncbi:MAG: PAS domain-containing protein, partial [Planctomycetes bacterium]|nr:PAS domain-containing protein [Planctomycetota bacterium]